MDIQLKTGCFDDAALVRRVVFMDEQGYENEFDAIDEDQSCIHVTLYAKAGYTQIAPVDYEDEGQPHVWMAKRVDGR